METSLRYGPSTQLYALRKRLLKRHRRDLHLGLQSEIDARTAIHQKDLHSSQRRRLCVWRSARHVSLTSHNCHSTLCDLLTSCSWAKLLFSSTDDIPELHLRRRLCYLLRARWSDVTASSCWIYLTLARPAVLWRLVDVHGMTRHDLPMDSMAD